MPISSQKIGSGAFSDVYLSRNNAVKVYKSRCWEGGCGKEMFQRELEALYKLQRHPYFLHTYRQSLSERSITMEYFAGQPLACFTDKKVQITQLVEKILLGVAFLHDNYIVHRDLHLCNILFDGDRVKIIDFGCSATVGCRGFGKAPLALRSPEAILGHSATEQEDIWTLGVALYEFVRPSSEFINRGLLRALKKCSRPYRSAIVLHAIKSRLQERVPDDMLMREHLDQRGKLCLDAYQEDVPEFDPPIHRVNFASRRPILHLLESMIRINPQDRLTACAALDHHIFQA
jgi:serine/threonine protein kinase